jgi:hypothetical protein
MLRGNSAMDDGNVIPLHDGELPCGPTDREALDFLTRDNTHAIRRIEGIVSDLAVGQDQMLRMMRLIVDDHERLMRQQIVWPKAAVLSTIFLAVAIGSALCTFLMTLSSHH